MQETEIKFYGHACILIRVGNTTVVTDPWFSKSGAFLASWFQFPDNTDLDLEPIRNANYIAISHGHEDHFDRKFLKTIDPKVKIIIPQYGSSKLYEELQALIPNEIIVAPTRETIQLGEGLTIIPVVQSVPAWEDCAYIFETPMGVIADTNDLKVMAPDQEWIKSHFSVDYLFAQFSGASWHPHVYNYNEETKVKKAHEKIKRKFESVRILSESLGARWLIPSAGPPCFLDPAHFSLNFNETSTFPDQREFYLYAKEFGFADRVAVLLPGDIFDPDSDNTAQNEKNISHPAFVDKRSYLTQYQANRLEVITKEHKDIAEPENELLEKARAYFQPLIASSGFFRQQIKGSLLLETQGGFPEKIIVNFADKMNPVRRPLPEDLPFYSLKTEAKFLNLVLEKKAEWESFFLSMRFRAERNPDAYNEAFVVFLKFASPELFRNYEAWDRARKNDATFILNHEGREYKVQRYCPHAMADLSRGQVVDGNLVCPGHGWQFSLKDGCCIQNKSKINVCCQDKDNSEPQITLVDL